MVCFKSAGLLFMSEWNWWKVKCLANMVEPIHIPQFSIPLPRSSKKAASCCFLLFNPHLWQPVKGWAQVLLLPACCIEERDGFNVGREKNKINLPFTKSSLDCILTSSWVKPNRVTSYTKRNVNISLNGVNIWLVDLCLCFSVSSLLTIFVLPLECYFTTRTWFLPERSAENIDFLFHHFHHSILLTADSHLLILITV